MAQAVQSPLLRSPEAAAAPEEGAGVNSGVNAALPAASTAGERWSAS